MAVMRRQVWAEMATEARAALMHRGLDDIFDPVLRRSIGELIDDVRERGDAAVVDALARFDGIDVEPSGLRVSDDEFEQAVVSDAVDRSIDDAITHLRVFNEQQLARADDWSFESEPGLTFLFSLPNPTFLLSSPPLASPCLASSYLIPSKTRVEEIKVRFHYYFLPRVFEGCVYRSNKGSAGGRHQPALLGTLGRRQESQEPPKVKQT